MIKFLLGLVIAAIISISSFVYEGKLFAQFDMNVSPQALIDSAKKGDPDAMFDLGNCMFEGICPGIERNDSQSIYWMQRAAAMDHGAALTMIGVMHCTGENKYIELDKAKGKKMMKRALRSGGPGVETMVNMFISICD